MVIIFLGEYRLDASWWHAQGDWHTSTQWISDGREMSIIQVVFKLRQGIYAKKTVGNNLDLNLL